jgi:hypothetical protein
MQEMILKKIKHQSPIVVTGVNIGIGSNIDQGSKQREQTNSYTDILNARDDFKKLHGIK